MAVVVVDHGWIVGRRPGESAEVGSVARSHGCHGVGLQVDMEFLCTFFVVS